MTTFKEIKGTLIKSLSSDPSPAAAGEMWYNSTSQTLKGVVLVSAWSSGGVYPGSQSYFAGMGTQTAGLAAGGDTPGVTNISAEYNGSSWTAGNNIGTARRGMAQAGGSPQTAGLIFGGSNGAVPTQYANVEEYDGTSWSEVNNMPANQNNFGGLGTQTAALQIGSNPGTATFEYDGTNWTAGGALGQTRTNSIGVGAGTQTAGLAVAGGPNPAVAGKVEEYNGTSWTAVTALPVVRQQTACCGTQTNALQSGGSDYPTSPSARNTSFSYDGTNWAAQANLGTSRYSQATSGGGTASLVVGGRTPVGTNATEEFSYSIFSPIAATWASGGNLGTARDEGGAAANAVSDAALYFGGYNGSALGVTEEYNGTSWSEQNDLITARSGRLGGAGTQTAGLCFGGNPGGGLNEEYDGTSWTERGDLNTPRNQLCGVGISTAALAYGGQTTPSGLNNTEEYDGSSWTAQNTLNTARYGFSGAGLQTSALAFCGVQSPPTISNDTEEYNGTSWTSVNDMIQPAFNHGGSGAQTAALLFGGQTGTSTGGAKTSAAFGYDGTNWSTRPSMGTTRSQISGSSGTSNISAAAFGGTIPPYSTATEEFTSATSVAGPASNITTS